MSPTKLKPYISTQQGRKEFCVEIKEWIRRIVNGLPGFNDLKVGKVSTYVNFLFNEIHLRDINMQRLEKEIADLKREREELKAKIKGLEKQFLIKK